MANRNHYFKVKPGDDERMLRDVDVQAVGLLHRLRLVTFDCEPVGFAVDHRRRPLDLAKLADTFYMPNGRFRTIFNELLERQLVQTAQQYRLSLGATSGGWSRLKADFLEKILSEFDVPLDDIYVVPTIADQFLDLSVGQRTGRTRRRDGGPVDRGHTGGASMGPLDGGRTGGAYTGPVDAHSHSHSQKPKPEPQPEPEPNGFEREREATAAARARAGLDEKRTVWLRNRVMEIRRNASLLAMAIADPEGYESEVRTLTGYSPEELAAITGDAGILVPESENDLENDSEVRETSIKSPAKTG